MALLGSDNLADLLHKRIAINPIKTAWHFRDFDAWQSMSWRDIEEKVFDLYLMLSDAGIRPGDRVAILASQQPQWSLIDLAILSAGAVTVPIHPSLTSDDVFYILKQSSAKAAFVGDASQWFKVKGSLGQLGEIEKVWSLSESPDEQAPFYLPILRECRARVTSLTDEMEQWRAIARKIDRSSLASIVFTSGTTGEPKGVPLSHGNFLSACEGGLSIIDIQEGDRSLFFLPPAHVLGRAELFLNLMGGWESYFCQNLNHFADYLVEVQPSFFISVPRVFEKIFSTVSSRFQSGLPFGRHLFAQALSVAMEYSKCLEQRRQPSLLLLQKYEFFNRILFSKVREKFGKRLRFAVVGGAAMSEKVSRFFHASGVLILEGYGLTETAGPICLNTPEHFRIGSVGKLFYKNRIRIADDGEILLKGDCVFEGYLSKEDIGLTEDGFFPTGDVGSIDHEGYLRIQDRKKDIIITSGGRNIAPQKIERLLASSPLISQAMVTGGGERSIGALISVDPKLARRQFRDNDMGFVNFDDWVKSSSFLERVWQEVRKINDTLPTHERVRRLRLLPRDLSVDAGELTPSLKVRRSFCERKFSTLIEDMYRD